MDNFETKTKYANFSEQIWHVKSVNFDKSMTSD